MQHLNFDLHNKTISVNFEINNHHKKEVFFGGRIRQLISTPSRVIILILHEYLQLKDVYLQNFKDLEDNNNIYCYDLDGNLLWQTGSMEFTTYGGDVYKHPANHMMMDGELLQTSYFMGLSRWLDPETGKVVKEEYFDDR